MEKKKTPTIQLQIMNMISAMFCGLLFFPVVKKNVYQKLSSFELTNGSGCFGGKVEAPEVSVTDAVVDKAVAAHPLVVRDGKVSAGVEMYEVDHVGERLEQSQHHLQVTSSRVYKKPSL